MIDLTASKIELAKRCVGAFTLPQTRSTNPYAEAGRERHAANEAAIGRGDIPPAIAEAFPAYEWRSEVAFAYDIATGEGRELAANGHRDYSGRSVFEACGTADMVGVLCRDGRIVRVAIVDQKSFDAVTRAAENPQVRFLALAAARAYGLDSASVGIMHELRPFDAAELEAFDLEEAALDIRRTVLGIVEARKLVREGLNVSFATGRWCRWCDSFDACPKQRELVALVESPAMQSEQMSAFRDDDDATRAYELWKRIGILHKRIGQSLYGRASERPIPLPNGLVFGARQKPGSEQLDGDIAYEAIRERHGQQVADAAVERAASKTRIREALKPIAGKGQLAALERAVLDEIRARGGAKRETRTVVEEYEPQRQLKAVP